MGKVLFENEYKMERKLYIEYVYKVLCKKTIIFGLAVAFFGAWLFILMNNKSTAYVMLATSLISIIFAIITPLITIKQLEETEKRLNNGNIEKTNIKFLNNIVMNEGKVHLEFEYHQIIKIVETKNFIVLKISEQSAILVLKEGFLIGNKYDFINFIKEQMSK